jgi:protein phosphatase
VAMSVRNKTMTVEEAKHDPRKNVLTQCVGVKEHINVYTATGKVAKNDFFILCCDGLYNKLQERELFYEVKELRDIDSDVLQQCSQKCVNIVKNRGERDNVSIIIVWLSCQESFMSKLKNMLVMIER